MARLLLTDDEWGCIADLFESKAGVGRPQKCRRTVVNGIFWILRTGAPWRDLPAEFGPWQTVWRLFDQWNHDGVWDAVVELLRADHIAAGEISNELWCVDGTTVRAARCCTGGGKKKTQRSRKIML